MNVDVEIEVNPPKARSDSTSRPAFGSPPELQSRSPAATSGQSRRRLRPAPPRDVWGPAAARPRGRFAVTPSACGPGTRPTCRCPQPTNAACQGAALLRRPVRGARRAGPPETPARSAVLPRDACAVLECDLRPVLLGLAVAAPRRHVSTSSRQSSPWSPPASSTRTERGQ